MEVGFPMLVACERHCVTQLTAWMEIDASFDWDIVVARYAWTMICTSLNGNVTMVGTISPLSLS
jgi:hypothetical protein